MKRRRPARIRTFAFFAAALFAGLLLGSLASSQSSGVSHQWADIQNIFVKQAQVDPTEICTIDGSGTGRPCPSYCAQNSFLGQTTLEYDGNMDETSNSLGGGYKQGDDVCRTAFPLGSAHMCDSVEVIRAARCGTNAPVLNGQLAWYSTGVNSVTPASGSPEITDCRGWTADGSNQIGSIWKGNAAQGDPTRRACNQFFPVLCCRGR